VAGMSSVIPTGLYVHVPFCIRKCLYCNFYVIPLGEGPLPRRLRDFRSLKHQGYLRALEQELQDLPQDFRPETVYIGGGTPTELPLEDLSRLFTMIRDHVDLSRLTELSCEANPGTLDQEMADMMVENGVTRMSLGVQSFHDGTLELLGRIHNAQEAWNAFTLLRKAGVQNLSLDLLFGLPTLCETVSCNLEAIDTLRPDHVSWYSLEYEEGTAFTDLRNRGDLVDPPEETTEREYAEIRRGLHHLGFHQYELFSFTQPGHECLHNLNYWKGGEYHACGPSAHRHVNGTRSANPSDLQAYLRDSAQQGNIEHLDPEQKARERLLTQLRVTQGVHIETFLQDTGYSIHTLLGEAYATWKRVGWMEERGGYVRLLPDAYLISDAIFRELI